MTNGLGDDHLRVVQRRTASPGQVLWPLRVAPTGGRPGRSGNSSAFTTTSSSSSTTTTSPPPPPPPPAPTAPLPPADAPPDQSGWVPAVGPVTASGDVRRGPSRLLFVAAGAVVALALLWLGYSTLSGGSQGLSEAIVVHEVASGARSGDLYVVDRVEDIENPARDDRVLRDVAVAGNVEVVDGDDVLSYGLFDYQHEGGPLFAFRDEDDDEWTVAVVDGREVVEIDQFDVPPRMLVTDSGLYLVENTLPNCSIFRLQGLSPERVARADYCAINGAADKAILADQRSSGTELSIIDLGTEEEVAVTELDPVDAMVVGFAPDNRTVMLSPLYTDTSADQETFVVDLESGEVVSEEDVGGVQATADGYFAFDFDNGSSGFEVSLVHVTNSGDSEEIVTGEWVDVRVDPSGTVAAIIESDGGNSGGGVLSMAPVGVDGLGALTEIDDLDGYVAQQWVGGGQLLLLDEDGVVELADGDRVVELGELRAASELWTPTIFHVSGDVWVLTVGDSVGVIVGGQDPSLVEIGDLETYQFASMSSDGRWLAISGQENFDSPGVALALVDLRDGQSEVVIEADSILDAQISDGQLYYTARDNDDLEVGRAPLGLGERAEELGEGVRLYVPNEPRTQKPRQWDRNNWVLNLAGN